MIVGIGSFSYKGAVAFSAVSLTFLFDYEVNEQYHILIFPSITKQYTVTAFV